MSFLIQRAAGRNLTLVQVNTPILRIGRGTNQELRSENPAVALEHAVIEGDAAGYLITDKGSITGTYVNRKPVETARLGKGDIIEVGDLRIDVQLADPAKPLFLRITVERPNVIVEEEGEEALASAVAAPGVKVVKSRKFDYAGAYKLRRPWLTKVTITALLLIVTLAVIGEVIRPERQKYFMPGGLSSAHARARHPKTGGIVADDCAACHNPWRGVSTAKCRDCHQEQSKPHARNSKNEMDCLSCHPEHRGAVELAAIPSTPCVACHTNLEPDMALPRARLASLKFAGGRYSFDDIARISAFGAGKHPEFSYPKDANTLRFNHKRHLAPKGVVDVSRKGMRTVLTCANCHDTTGVDDPKPIAYERHCHSCHPLDFDPDLPGKEVPHGGDSMNVFGAIAAHYAGDRDIIGKPPAEVRRIRSARTRMNVDRRALFRSENTFKIRCRECHELMSGARLAVTPPVIPTAWLTRAPNFKHSGHRMIDCEKCHEGVRQSSATSDVLLPKLSNCTECHAGTDRTAQKASTCRACHRYHL
ncbi:MAG: FHA domain-containing protein [Thermoanaerobaculia bacterium]